MTKLDKSFVATSILLSRHVLLRQTRVCHDKTFVAPKMILVAVPANDTKHPCLIQYFIRAKHPHTNADCEVEAKLEIMLVFDEHISPCNLAFISFKC